jgi:hypothetical protein
MKKTAEMVLPLHYGAAPPWLVTRMKGLADEMVRLLVEEDGPDAFLVKLSDPLWFQAFGCLLGFDWHSSGLTTVVTGVLKDVLSLEKHRVRMAGGKGRASKRVQEEIAAIGDGMGLSSARTEGLGYASRMTSKVDTSALQAGYPLYHHAFFVAEGGRQWAVVQQGINTKDKTARRYHWLSEGLESFVVEPQKAIVGGGQEGPRAMVLNMTAAEAEESRRVCVDLVRGNPENLESSIRRIGNRRSDGAIVDGVKVKKRRRSIYSDGRAASSSSAATLDLWIDLEGEKIRPSPQHSSSSTSSFIFESYEMPTRLNWPLFRKLYDVQPRDFEELLACRGVGPATVRALALVGQLVYGKPISWRDPVKFSFAHGGKDGVPYPVDRSAMDGSIKTLRDMVSATGVERARRTEALERLSELSVQWGL